MNVERLKQEVERFDEFCASKMTSKDYTEELKKKFISGKDIQQGPLTIGQIYHNPSQDDHTGDRIAFGNIPWIEYWRRLIGFNNSHLKCSFCGEEIFIDIDSDSCTTWRMDHPDERMYRVKEDYQAEGGHYYKNSKDNSDGYIIIPVCKKCNGRGEGFDLKVVESNHFVEEVGATIKEDKTICE